MTGCYREAVSRRGRAGGRGSWRREVSGACKREFVFGGRDFLEGRQRVEHVKSSNIISCRKHKPHKYAKPFMSDPRNHVIPHPDPQHATHNPSIKTQHPKKISRYHRKSLENGNFSGITECNTAVKSIIILTKKGSVGKESNFIMASPA